MSLSLNPFSVGYWMHGFAWREPKKSDEPVLSENANGAEGRILEAFSKLAETSRRGTGSAIGDPEQTSPAD